MAYDAMSEMISRTGRHWTHSLRTFTATYVNGRNIDPLWHYDAAGNITQDGNVDGIRQYTFDAAGRQIQSYDPPRPPQPAVVVQQSYDGNGTRVKNQQTGYPNPYLKYEVRSSVLGGQVVAEINSSGQKLRTNVYAWGEMIAYQWQGQVFRVHRSPIGSAVFEGVGVGAREVELDPLGNSVGVENPYQGGGWGGGGYPSYGDGGDTMRCAVDGDLRPCRMVIGNHYFSWLSVIIRSYFRGNLPVSNSVTTPGGEPAPEPPTQPGDLIPVGDETKPKPFELYINAAYLPITINTISYVTLRIDRPTVAYTYVFPRGDFLIGRFGFNQNEIIRLANAYGRVDSEKCHKFFDATLANLRKQGQIASQSRFTPSTLRGILNITTLNRYSSSLTARQVGVSQRSWEYVQSRFANPDGSRIASGVTLADGRVFLADNAFYQAGLLAGVYGYRSADLSGIIVHEFFHRAGLSESQIVALHAEIQANCGIPGFAL